MPTLVLSNFNIVTAIMGGFITLYGLVSFIAKDRYYLSEPLVAVVAGILFKHGAHWLRPEEYTLHSQQNLEFVTLSFARLALGVQLVLAGVQLPSRYLRTEWKSMALLLGPGMAGMWLVSSLLMWALVPHVTFLWALAMGACIAPTDPVLSNSIVKGKFADKNLPKELQHLVIAESGANDGLGYPFLFFALYLIKYCGEGGIGQPSTGVGHSMGYWFAETWAYVILLSVVYGAVVGFLAAAALRFAGKNRWIDHENFLVFPIALALFIVGTCGMVGTDDLLACFIAGSVFAWIDSFKEETEDEEFQPTIDMLLNLAIFMWFGAVCPWYDFVHNHGLIPIYRLAALGILILMCRRLPVVWALSRWIPQCRTLKHTLFIGYFGPIGVGACFYLHVALEFLHLIEVDGHQRKDAHELAEVLRLVVWFVIMCSIVIHGLSVSLGVLGLGIEHKLEHTVEDVRAQSIFIPGTCVHLHHAQRVDGLQAPPKAAKGGKVVFTSGDESEIDLPMHGQAGPRREIV